MLFEHYFEELTFKVLTNMTNVAEHPQLSHSDYLCMVIYRFIECIITLIEKKNDQKQNQMYIGSKKPNNWQ